MIVTIPSNRNISNNKYQCHNCNNIESVSILPFRYGLFKKYLHTYTCQNCITNHNGIQGIIIRCAEPSCNLQFSGATAYKDWHTHYAINHPTKEFLRVNESSICDDVGCSIVIPNGNAIASIMFRPHNPTITLPTTPQIPIFNQRDHHYVVIMFNYR